MCFIGRVFVYVYIYVYEGVYACVVCVYGGFRRDVGLMTFLV